MNIAAIPETLRALPQWVVWRLEMRAGKPEPTKIPYNARTGRAASSINPRTWATFEEAAQAYALGRWDGIGFAFAPGGGIVGMDLDHCRDPESGVIQPWAQRIIDRMASYSELSPSGAGVHIFVHGGLPPDSKHVKRIDGNPGKIELYGEKRFFTVTGRHLSGTPPTVEHRQAELNALYAEWFDQPAAAPGLQPAIRIHLNFTEAPTEADRALSARVLNEHPKIIRTWMADESDGDYAFACTVLRELLQTHGAAAADEDLIGAADRAFRASPLFERPDRQAKWMRPGPSGYAEQTLRAALQEVRAEQARQPDDLDRRYQEHAEELTQHERFAGRLLWVEKRRVWLEWTGRVWAEISEERLLEGASVALQAVYLSRLRGVSSAEKRKRLLGRYKEACQPAPLSEAFKFLRGKPGFFISAADLDKDPWKFNVLNGVLDLRKSTLELHDPADHFTKLAPVTYDPAARGERWERFLARILPDPDVRRYVQRKLGKAMVGEPLEESLDIWWGEGANGKTTFSQVMIGVFGDYAKRAASGLLVASKHKEHPTELADLIGSRLVFSVEIDRGERLAEALVKELTGGDKKKARYLYRDYEQFDQTFDIVLIVNHPPVIEGTDLGIWRRIHIIPFAEIIPREEQRPQPELVRELLADAPAILKWLLEGLRDFLQDPVWVPDTVLAATESYREEQDRLGRFLDDCCERGPSCSAPGAALYAAYEEWCRVAGEDPMTKNAFGRALRERGFRSEKRGHSNVRVWHGLRIRPAAAVGSAAV